VCTLAVASAIACSAKGGEKKSRVEGSPITEPFEENFDSESLGANFFATTDNYKAVNGALSAKGAFNHPLWLTKKLPKNVSIEFDTWTNSEDADIKVEIFGDGESHAATKEKVAYKATGYVAVFGGWSNSRSILARRDEHGTPGVDLEERRSPKVEIGKRYHWKLTRQDNTLSWFIDDMTTPFLRFEDKSPLVGSGQDYFAFNNWQSDTWFDNLRISPL
jgi:hypothetical protein